MVAERPEEDFLNPERDDRSRVKSCHIKYLENLEHASVGGKLDDYYLWPRTPIDDIQPKILQRVGATDYQIEVSYSRSTRIVRQLGALLKENLIAPDFSILDIACGDAIILWQIKKAFGAAHCFGVDCNKDEITTHDMVQRDGVRLYRGFIQHLFQSHVDEPFDVVLMLNTYRGWESADLREHEHELPNLADAWFERNARYTILTATRSQIECLRKSDFAIQEMGKGEDDSTMVCLSKYELPGLPLQHSVWRWLRWKFTRIME